MSLLVFIFIVNFETSKNGVILVEQEIFLKS
jgi:hypothetical protein